MQTIRNVTLLNKAQKHDFETYFFHFQISETFWKFEINYIITLNKFSLNLITLNFCWPFHKRETKTAVTVLFYKTYCLKGTYSHPKNNIFQWWRDSPLYEVEIKDLLKKDHYVKWSMHLIYQNLQNLKYSNTKNSSHQH